MLNIYLVKTNPYPAFDQYDKFVASSESVDSVIFVHPDTNGNYHWDPTDRRWVDDCGYTDRGNWGSPYDLTVELIGTTEENTPRVYCASYYPLSLG